MAKNTQRTSATKAVICCPNGVSIPIAPPQRASIVAANAAVKKRSPFLIIPQLKCGLFQTKAARSNVKGRRPSVASFTIRQSKTILARSCETGVVWRQLISDNFGHWNCVTLRDSCRIAFMRHWQAFLDFDGFVLTSVLTNADLSVGTHVTT
jgi:hypothetical protein